eukprot:1186776-Prorocentrum_minimum.AAC.5
MRCTVVRSQCVRAQVTGSRGTSFHTRAPRCGPFRGTVHPGNRSLIRLTRTPGATGETSAAFGERTGDWPEDVREASSLVDGLLENIKDTGKMLRPGVPTVYAIITGIWKQ